MGKLLGYVMALGIGLAIAAGWLFYARHPDMLTDIPYMVYGILCAAFLLMINLLLCFVFSRD